MHVLLLKTIYFKQNHHFIFEKTLPYMDNFNFDGFKHYNANEYFIKHKS
jgi:hypothetical protein